jgi:ketosteroid isomerase-like protein
MNRLTISIATVLAALYINAHTMTAQSPDTPESEVASVDIQRCEALTRGDVQALDHMLSKDLVYTHATGWRQTKAEFLASVRSGELRYHVFTMHTVSSHAYGNTVIVTGSASGKVLNKGQDLDVSLLFLEAYVKQEGRWQLVAWQSTRATQ